MILGAIKTNLTNYSETFMYIKCKITYVGETVTYSSHLAFFPLF